jgi:hypothetical protein
MEGEKFWRYIPSFEVPYKVLPWALDLEPDARGCMILDKLLYLSEPTCPPPQILCALQRVMVISIWHTVDSKGEGECHHQPPKIWPCGLTFYLHHWVSSWWGPYHLPHCGAQWMFYKSVNKQMNPELWEILCRLQALFLTQIHVGHNARKFFQASESRRKLKQATVLRWSEVVHSISFVPAALALILSLVRFTSLQTSLPGLAHQILPMPQ